MSIHRRFVALFVTLVGAFAVSIAANAATFLNQWGGGSLGFVVDGTSNTIQFTENSRIAVCVDNVGFSMPIGSITDGTSNTLAFTESNPWSLQVGFVRPRQPIGSITDGTSNTIIFGEVQTDAICFGDGSVIPAITDGSSNTIMFGEQSSFDVCVSNARLGTVTDGTSNTIMFGEVVSDPQCFIGARVAPELVAGVPEPTSLLLAGMAFAGLGAVSFRRHAA